MGPIKLLKQRRHLQITSSASCFPLAGSKQLLNLHARAMYCHVQASGTIREGKTSLSAPWHCVVTASA